MRLAILSLVLCTLVWGCGSNDYRAPVENRNARPPVSSPAASPAPAAATRPDVYRVQGGDTLYSIAFRYGLDYRQLAAANGIDSNYRIYPGQRLYLKRSAAPVSRPAAKPAASSGSSGAVSGPAPVRPAAAKPASKPPAATGTGTTTPRPATTTRPPAAQRAEPNAAVSRWRWPSDGRVIRRFSASLHKGVDLDGKRGDPVRAVAAGRVVYAGSGIVGYGELLIIKHNAVYLSAYGHNDKLLVAEGADVKVGDVIAEKGDTGTNRVKLHFEIRRDGKPIDPLTLLPSR